jgi:hypothetical protein
LYDKDDKSGRPRWTIESSPVSGEYRIFMNDKCLTFGNILNSSAVASITLNPASNCGTEYNYWAIQDIGSGLIRIKPAKNWYVKPMYLSTTADGSKVDMFDRDDGSGRQRWKATIVR